MTRLHIGYFYPEDLNLYGDTGNVEILKYRAKERGFDVKVTEVTAHSTPDFSDFNLIFMGGGPDSGQKHMYADLIENKGPRLKDYIERGGVALFICGSYQLMGHYYKSVSGEIVSGEELNIKGTGALDLYTEHYGHKSKRCVGNVVCNINSKLLDNPTFSATNFIGDSLIGFENHGGQTFLNEGVSALATVHTGFGNNLADKTEGVYYKNTLGTYLHGPILSKNPHIADFLIAQALQQTSLKPLPIDAIIKKTHAALLSRFK